MYYSTYGCMFWTSLPIPMILHFESWFSLIYFLLHVIFNIKGEDYDCLDYATLCLFIFY